jgi:kynurenine formamidase
VTYAAHDFLAERRVPSSAELLAYLRQTSNAGRWGRDDQLGALNLITPDKRVAAARLVRSGRVVSLGRDYPKLAGPGNARPAQHFMHRWSKPEGGGVATDYYATSSHQGTHLDALCHVWDDFGMWNGRNPDDVITFDGATFGSIDHWRQGIVTRGVLLNVPAHRGVGYVTADAPVYGWELEDIARAQGVEVGAGDAVAVYCGFDAFRRDGQVYSGYSHEHQPTGGRPGLDASCLRFFREHDAAVLLWDMGDRMPYGYDLAFEVHYAIVAYGMALVDAALLEPLAQACVEEQRYEFMLMTSPLVVAGGTGCPVNPLALF